MQKFLIIFCLSIAVLVAPVSSFAASRNWEYSKRTESFMKAAAYSYYSGKGELDNSNITCMPNEVRIEYVYYDENWGARAPYDAGLASAKNQSYYCSFQINRKYKATRGIACLNFIHEYGHLIGKRHNDNIQSPMYNSYASEKDPDKFKELYNRWRKIIMAKTVCDSAKIKG